jgi:SAM-dependent methyltransferase
MRRKGRVLRREQEPSFISRMVESRVQHEESISKRWSIGVKMHFEPFVVSPHNETYDGDLSQHEIEWLRASAPDKANHIQELLAGTAVASVLEVGCGTGAVLAELVRRKIGQRHVGIDMTNPQEHLDPLVRTLGIEFLQYDGGRLPFPDQSFDLVYASHVVEHVPDPRGFLAELQRVAKRFVVTEVPCELHWRASRDALQRTLAIGHINAYTPESYALLLQTAALSPVRSGLYDHCLAVHAFHGSPVKARVKKAIRGSLLGLSPQMASRLFTYHYAVICEVGRQGH